jgi:MFS family permease
MWLWSAPFWAWTLVSIGLGLGFTFFSGAVEAWLVDALRASGYDGELDPVFSKGMIVGGIAMLAGSILGGIVAQVTDLGVPFLLRAGVLLLTFVLALFTMRDIGFTPDKSEGTVAAIRTVARGSVKHGLGNPPVRYLMLAAPFTAGVGIYVFYALQPYLLELWGDEKAYSIAGIAAAVIAGSQVVGGLLAPKARGLFRKRTTVLLLSAIISAVILLSLGLAGNFWVALVLLIVWGVTSSIDDPIRRAYLNGLIPSKQRATVLSFESLMGNVGGIAIQPALGRVADISTYSLSLVFSGIISAVAIPFVALSRKQNAPADRSARDETGTDAAVGPTNGE